MVFNEIKFANDLHKIRNIKIASKVENNFILVSIDGAVHKFDLHSKELDYKFQANCFKSMILFNEDRKLLTADT